MKRPFEKFQKTKVESLFNIKGGTELAGKTSTTKLRTNETSNDSDSNAQIEGTLTTDLIQEP